MKPFIVLAFLLIITKLSFAKEVFRKPSSHENFVIEQRSCLPSENIDNDPVQMLEAAKKENYELISVAKVSGNTKSSSTCAYYLRKK